jgi:hypothetical protein
LCSNDANAAAAAAAGDDDDDDDVDDNNNNSQRFGYMLLKCARTLQLRLLVRKENEMGHRASDKRNEVCSSESK